MEKLREYIRLRDLTRRERRELNVECDEEIAKDALELIEKQEKVLNELITVGYPHNFQHEAPHVAQYCRDITKVITKAFEVMRNG